MQCEVMTDTIERHTITTYEPDPNLVVELNVRFGSLADLKLGARKFRPETSAYGQKQSFPDSGNPITRPNSTSGRS